MSTITELEEKVKELLKEIETLKQQEKSEEFTYPFEKYERYWLVDEKGKIVKNRWNYLDYDKPRYDQGHVFKTKEDAERERDKRALLTRFRQFRDKCNGDWNPGEDDEKHYINILSNKVFIVATDVSLSSYPIFGYFKTEFDCLHAIDLFGDEIKRLWVEE